MSKEKNILGDGYSRPRWIKLEKIRADINEREGKNKKLWWLTNVDSLNRLIRQTILSQTDKDRRIFKQSKKK